MAIIPENKYPGQIISADANYPFGSARDVDVPGDGKGTPLKLGWVNDLWGLLQGLLRKTNITPTDTPDTAINSQYLDAVELMTKADRKHVKTYNAVGFETTRMTIEPCVVWDVTGTKLINLTTTITKDITSAWAVGNNNGGRTIAALAADTGYHRIIIVKETGDTTPDLVDAGWDTNADGSQLLSESGYDYAARIGFDHTEPLSTNLEIIKKYGDIFTWGVWYDFNYSTIPATSGVLEPAPVAVPGGVRTEAFLRFWGEAGTAQVRVNVTNDMQGGGSMDMVSFPANEIGSGAVPLVTNTDSTIDWTYFSTIVPVEMWVAAHAYRDFLTIE